jgi:hypothetical protein
MIVLPTSFSGNRTLMTQILRRWPLINIFIHGGVSHHAVSSENFAAKGTKDTKRI